MAISNWRMSRDGAHPAGLIGPNAILQMLPVLEKLGGPERQAEILAAAGIFHLPDGNSMIPETDAARLHHQLRLEEPLMAPALAAHAGYNTGKYILAHRIPKPAQWLLKGLPKGVAARLLSRAITHHAWTFAGSGHFRAVTPWTFEIEDNPLVRGEISERCLCDWHVGVFTQLYRTLVSRTCTCVETRCGAQTGERCCHFELRG